MSRLRTAWVLAAALSLSACALLRPGPGELAVDREDPSLPEPEAHVPIYWERSLPPCGVTPIGRIEGPTRASLRRQAIGVGGNAVIDAGRRIVGARSRGAAYMQPSSEVYWGTAVRISGKCRP